MKKVGIIGFGNIGRPLYDKALACDWEIAFVANRRYIMCGQPLKAVDAGENWLRYCQGVDLVFLAIPTHDDGRQALQYIQELTAMGISVVTCEKGALANYFSELKLVLKQLGYSATVGGGSGIIPFLRQRFFSGIREVHVILNGTLNYTWNDLGMGNPLGHIVDETQRLGYSEPGQSDPIKIILGEAGSDAVKKTAILYNLCFRSPKILRAQNIEVKLTPAMVRQAIREAVDRRFVVSFEREANFEGDSEDILAFTQRLDGWVITAGFKRTDRNPLVARLCQSASWVNNSLLTVEGDNGKDGVYLCVGPGAGAQPTTAAMIRDAEALLAL